jgi:hypothetical protein
MMVNSTSGTKFDQSPARSPEKQRSTSESARTQFTRPTLLVVLWRCGEPKMSATSNAACSQIRNALVKRVSRH